MTSPALDSIMPAQVTMVTIRPPHPCPIQSLPSAKVTLSRTSFSSYHLLHILFVLIPFVKSERERKILCSLTNAWQDKFRVLERLLLLLEVCRLRRFALSIRPWWMYGGWRDGLLLFLNSPPVVKQIIWSISHSSCTVKLCTGVETVQCWLDIAWLSLNFIL